MQKYHERVEKFMNYENKLKKLKQQKRAKPKPRYSWPLIAVLGLVGAGLLVNGLAWLGEVWATRPVYTMGDGLMIMGVALFLLLGLGSVD